MHNMTEIKQPNHGNLLRNNLMGQQSNQDEDRYSVTKTDRSVYTTPPPYHLNNIPRKGGL